MLRWISLVLIGLLASLQYQLWFGRGGFHDLQRLEKAVAEQRHENQQLLERNQKLLVEVLDLKNGFEAVEERARLELGMVRPDETYYQVVERSATVPAQ